MALVMAEPAPKCKRVAAGGERPPFRTAGAVSVPAGPGGENPLQAAGASA